MPHPLSSTQGTIRLTLTRKELDFALGLGSAIVNVEISLEVCEDAEADMIHPLARQTTQELRDEEADEPASIAATLITATAAGVGEAVEAKQAADD
jgi:phosphatidylinositol-3,4,5-trisphosphate 3-phosphatase/dual-specificity protein phosphatase PTEN